MSTRTNKAIIARMVEQLWNQGRIDLVEEFFAEDYVEHIPGRPDSTGLQHMGKAVTDTRNAYPDFNLNIDSLVAEGDSVAARWSMTGTHEGEFYGIPPTGKKIGHTGTTFYRLENGRIAEIWFLADMMGLMQQLGVVPAPEAA
jgi:steroid delta-isomerase-like uncharacterized protein